MPLKATEPPLGGEGLRRYVIVRHAGDNGSLSESRGIYEVPHPSAPVEAEQRAGSERSKTKQQRHGRDDCRTAVCRQPRVDIDGNDEPGGWNDGVSRTPDYPYRSVFNAR
eukprot:scaffold89207_cov33-Prasinocladus_malaysianus.AAC.1